MTRIALLAIMLLVLPGCSSTNGTSGDTPHKTIWDDAQEYAYKGQNKKSWESLVHTPPSMTDKTQQFLINNPAVYESRKEEFSIDSLTALKAKDYKITYAYKALDNFNLYANKKDQKWAEANVKKVFGTKPKSYIRGNPTNRDFSTVNSQSISKFGRVAGVQVVNRSHINTGTGAGLGAVAGQAMYLDRTSWGNYSAMNQLGAGLLGAMVGSALDQPTSIAYERRYWITLNDGNTISISTTGSDNTHIPQGVCVSVYGSNSIEPTNESNCKKK